MTLFRYFVTNTKRTATHKYYVSILVQREVNEVIPSVVDAELTIGGDLGIKTFLTLSDGQAIANPKFLRKQLVSLKRHQRIFSRQKKSSTSRAKQKLVVAKLHENVGFARKDFIHQVSHQIAVKNQATTYIAEDLKIKNMVRNGNLARSISDCGWGLFYNALEYKLKDHGKNFLKISTFAPSSKECRICLKKNGHLKLSDRVFVCPTCGHTEERDLHAAKNIKRMGLNDYFESAGIAGTVKRSSLQ